jgi:hypothetical protein
MGRNIKHYIGTYFAPTNAWYGNQSTGYTVPSGKVARIGFNVMAVGGTPTNTSTNRNNVSGFYAGSAGSTSTGSNTNRFLLAHTHTTASSNGASGIGMTLTYDAANGQHRWSAPSLADKTPQMWIGDNHRERYTVRNNNEWYYNNFYYVTNNSNGLGFTSWGTRENSVIKYQLQHFAPAYKVYQNNTTETTARQGGLIEGTTTNGPAHAFAGETIYVFDFNPGDGYNNAAYRNWQKAAWSMFIIEEDA